MQLFWLWKRNRLYFADSGDAAILVAGPEPPLFSRRWGHSYFGCVTGTTLIFPALEPQLFWLRNRNRPYFGNAGDAAILVVELFYLRNRNHPFFAYAGASPILFAEPEPPLFCQH